MTCAHLEHFIRTEEEEETLSLRAHSTWLLVGRGSLLEVVHGMAPPDYVCMVFAGCVLEPCATLSETQAPDRGTIYIVIRTRFRKTLLALSEYCNIILYTIYYVLYNIVYYVSLIKLKVLLAAAVSKMPSSTPSWHNRSAQ